jgi:hypothetical protein
LTEHFHYCVDDGVVLGGHVGLASDRSDSRHDELLLDRLRGRWNAWCWVSGDPGPPALSAPILHDLPENRELADVIGIVVDDEYRLPQDRLPVTMRDLRV